jgi:hypothetical protein
MKKIGLIILFYSLSFTPLFCQFNFDTILNQNALLKKLTSKADKYHIQIIYTQIDSIENEPVFTDYYFNVNSQNYFYCASLIKLPVSILSLQKLNELGIKSNAVMFTDSSIACHRKVKSDTSSITNFPSAEHYIKKMLLVSDNEAYSRMYEFLGVDYLHENLLKKGYSEIRILNRYDGNCKGKDNLISNPVIFLDENLHVLYRQEQITPSQTFSFPKINMNVGKAYYNEKNKLVSKPKNFSGSNYMSLKDCHSILKDLIFKSPNSFQISDDQRNFLTRYLSYYPRESASPKYNSKVYYDSYKKYLFYGDSKNTITDTNLIITNIVGQSYGFMSDCTYFSDKKNKIHFMLSAVIYANEDEILNDGKYDYRNIALPYLAELGRQFYRYELKRNAIKK